MSTMPAVGDLAPDFALPDAQGTVHRLADQRGRWTVVYFYPEDDTRGCTVEACEFRDANAEIAATGAAVWGISPQGADSKAAFRDKYTLNFPLLSDEGHAVADAYGTWILREKNGTTFWQTGRSTFLVDPDGRIARVWQKVTPEGHASDVLGAITELQGAVAR